MSDPADRPSPTAAVWVAITGREVRMSHNGMDPASLVEPAPQVAISSGWTDFVGDFG